jgi:glycerophosphoryl diester phosphodiesterase
MLFLILDPDSENKTINKKWTTLDMWVTVLAQMWFEIEKLGFWVNLFSDLKSFDNSLLKNYKKYFESFWWYPSIEKWINFKINTNNIIIDNKNIEFPNIIQLDEKNNINKILWNNSWSKDKLHTKIPENINSIYIKKCKNNICIIFTNKLWEKNEITIKSNKNISKEEIINYFKKNNKIIINNPKRIAHAGGMLNWKTYTNSIDALNKNKNFYNLFEMDFSWTSDNKLVCLHDWWSNFSNNFWFKLNWNIPNYDEFNSFVNKNKLLKSCTLESLIDWLEENPSKYIITDIKEKNYEWLKYISQKYPKLKNKFIVQMYNPLDYKEIKKLWYNNIIWTLYAYSWDNKDVLKHLQNMDLFAVTMPKERAYTWFWTEIKNIYKYTHTINSSDDLIKLQNLWIDEIYTDSLN